MTSYLFWGPGNISRGSLWKDDGRTVSCAKNAGIAAFCAGKCIGSFCGLESIKKKPKSLCGFFALCVGQQNLGWKQPPHPPQC